MKRASLACAGALIGLVVAAVLGRACELAAPEVPGAVVQVHPAIRAWDAGRDR